MIVMSTPVYESVRVAALDGIPAATGYPPHHPDIYRQLCSEFGHDPRTGERLASRQWQALKFPVSGTHSRDALLRRWAAAVADVRACSPRIWSTRSSGSPGAPKTAPVLCPRSLRSAMPRATSRGPVTRPTTLHPPLHRPRRGARPGRCADRGGGEDARRGPREDRHGRVGWLTRAARLPPEHGRAPGRRPPAGPSAAPRGRRID